MSKIITSPVEKFQGTIVLQSPIIFDLYLEWMDIAQEAAEKKTTKEMVFTYIPMLCKLIERADIVGMVEHPTVETWPKTPAPSVLALVAWLVNEARSLIAEADTIPPD